MVTLGIVSDIHYAGAAERARGNDYEIRGLANPLLRLFVRGHRHFVWKRDPLNQNHLLDGFLATVQAAGQAHLGDPLLRWFVRGHRHFVWKRDPLNQNHLLDGFLATVRVDLVVANGDYSCNSAFVGVSDDAACQSASECLGKLREKFGANFRATYGDHELGKLSFFGGLGGMRLESWRRAREELKLQPFWQLQIGKYVLIGVVSSLIALPIFEPDTLPAERPQWERLRVEHLTEIQEAFAALHPEQRVLLFCHDPTALPFLWRDEIIRSRLPQIEQTIIGHLHSNLILWKSRLLAGMPRITFLGNTSRKLSAALHEARHWRAFNLRLCPALGGIELLKDGGYLTAQLDPDARRPARFEFHRLARG